VCSEYAQFVELQLPNGTTCVVANVYLPPTNNLARRNLTELTVRDSCMAILARIPAESQLLLCGDFNARTGSLTPLLEGQTHPPRTASDPVVCPRGRWILEVSTLF
jgi:endonuclease/exonuclease/phosphatase family metal-dependent hydrolase